MGAKKPIILIAYLWKEQEAFEGEKAKPLANFCRKGVRGDKPVESDEEASALRGLF